MYKSFLLASLLCAAGLTTSLVQADDNSRLPVTVSPVTVMLIEQREISFHDAGLLDSLQVSEGQAVAAGQILAQLDSRKEELAVEAATVNLQAAEFQLDNRLAVETARATLAENRAALQPLQATLEIARKAGESDVPVQLAETDRDTFQVELERAQRARERYASSVSASEIVRLEAQARKGVLGVQKAKTDLEMARLQPGVHEAQIEEQNSRIARHELLLAQEIKNLELLKMDADTRRNQLRQAELALSRRTVRAPLAGEVAEVHRHPGEWVEPGAAVVRLIQLQKLRVEGYVDVALTAVDLKDRVVTISFPGQLQSLGTIQGRITHVSPEVDSLNQQLIVWAEFDNPRQQVRPGMVGQMTIHPQKASDGPTALPKATAAGSAGSGGGRRSQ